MPPHRRRRTRSNTPFSSVTVVGRTKWSPYTSTTLFIASRVAADMNNKNLHATTQGAAVDVHSSQTRYRPDGSYRGSRGTRLSSSSQANNHSGLMTSLLPALMRFWTCSHDDGHTCARTHTSPSWQCKHGVVTGETNTATPATRARTRRLDSEEAMMKSVLSPMLF